MPAPPARTRATSSGALPSQSSLTAVTPPYSLRSVCSSAEASCNASMSSPLVRIEMSASSPRMEVRTVTSPPCGSVPVRLRSRSPIPRAVKPARCSAGISSSTTWPMVVPDPASAPPMAPARAEGKLLPGERREVSLRVHAVLGPDLFPDPDDRPLDLADDFRGRVRRGAGREGNLHGDHVAVERGRGLHRHPASPQEAQRQGQGEHPEGQRRQAVPQRPAERGAVEDLDGPVKSALEAGPDPGEPAAWPHSQSPVRHGGGAGSRRRPRARRRARG